MLPSFESRTCVNGNMLRNFNEGNISIMLRVEDEAGGNLIAISTDKQKIHVSLPDNDHLGARKGNWVEIIGNRTGSDSIQAKEAILFSEDDTDFDEEGYNMMIQLLSNGKNIFRKSQLG